MKKVLTTFVSLLIACSVGLTALFGCSKKDKSEDYTQISATSVAYSADGKYTTEVTGADFSGVSKDDVKVYYTVLDEQGYQTALDENAGAEEITESTAPEPGKLEVVDEIPADDGGGWTIPNTFNLNRLR